MCCTGLGKRQQSLRLWWRSWKSKGGEEKFREKTGSTWGEAGVGDEREDIEDMEVLPRFLACPGEWKEGSAICRGGKYSERTGFWDEITSLVSDMLSLKDL